jgi:hypothetical protein
MNNLWIEVGEALLNKENIVAVDEPEYEKYDEKWSFQIFVSDGSLRSTVITIHNKDEAALRKVHTELKNTLRG